ncbi:hypothetical protein P280DRAFT_396724 [Massarina eburnea CBS 473.64]|uniref:Uncharacterized protein n=1 Tax=Massarina eburnea CBS 473.64 TaxID=1395130 RepID=A0A6A6S311_9PLEO|nr:hypothetical protein P280DRAFT_396724 [Massarina eburnea CBS 473.64]
MQDDWLSPDKRVNYGPCLGPESSRVVDRLSPQDNLDHGLSTPGSSSANYDTNNTSNIDKFGFAEPFELNWDGHIDSSFIAVDEDAISTPEEVCFGMLPGVEMRFNNGIDPISSPLGQQTESNFLTLGLSFTQNRCDILLSSEMVVAVLNMKSFRSLASVQEEVSIRLEGSVKLPIRPQSNNQPKGKKDLRYCSVDILVFGYRDNAELVAAKLAANDFFLQDPNHTPPGFSYENPQCLDLPQILVTKGSQVKRKVVKKTVLERDRVVDQEDDFELDYDRLLDDFACHDDLVQATVVAQVSTTLLIHQREGLDFILQREMKPSAPNRRLWEEKNSDEDETSKPIYRHIITGARSPSAKECVGGIIADEMGLGKSLTILSAIAGSLDRAFTYARTMTNIDASGRGIIAAKSTLVIVPSALLIESWISEIERHIVPDTLSYYKFHGQSRNMNYLQVVQHDIVFTTYGTVAADFVRNRSLLHLVHWYRIVLDEAHVIRNVSTKQSSAVTALQCWLRWCLTGTPIQNSLDDLFSLARFLKVPILDDAAQFKRHIIAPIDNASVDTPKDYRNLRTLLSTLCLRRTKAVLPIAQVATYTHELDFTSEERAGYRRIEHICTEALDLAVSGHKGKEAHQTVLEILLRLRLFCNNGSTFEGSDSQENLCLKDPEEALSLLQQTGQAICHYCSCDITSASGAENGAVVVTICHHAICSECTPRWKSAISNRTHCPICKVTHSMEPSMLEGSANIPSIANYPSKIQSLCEDIQLHRREGKCVVFSFWRKSLDVVGSLLEAKNIPYLRVDGTVLFSKRKTILNQFQERHDIPVILMTLGTGAVGLNGLYVANRIHLLEPQWNPSIESQAIGRVVRLGQQRPVTVVRYIMNRTVEKVVTCRTITVRIH